MTYLKEKPFYLSDEQLAWVRESLVSLSDEEKAGQLFCVFLPPPKCKNISVIFTILCWIFLLKHGFPGAKIRVGEK